MQIESSVNIEPYKFGKFWIVENKKWNISRTDVITIANKIGFGLYRGSLFRIVGKFIIPATERDFQDVLREYLEDTGIIGYLEILNSLEAFFQKNGKFTISRLQIISDELFLNDTQNICYKFFKNVFIQITTSELNAHTYDQLPPDKYVLFSKIQQRDFKPSQSGKYLDFLSKATSWSIYSQNIKTILGYLCHEYKDETTGYIIVLTEQCPDPKDGGGSGKNLFCNLLSHSTTYCSKPGVQSKFDEKFFQSWNGQRLFGISDVPKNFNFSFLKEPSTGSFILKKLYKDEVEIPVSDGPKFIVHTNFSYEISDGGLKRRIIPIEFTDFFTKSGGVDAHYSCHFPKGWHENDWNNFDTIIIESIQTWLKSNRKIQSASLTETGWEKQFIHSHGKTITDFIQENFDNWIKLQEVPSTDIRTSLSTFYSENAIDRKYQHSAQRIASAIKEWSHHFGFECQANKQRDILGINVKCYVFSEISQPT